MRKLSPTPFQQSPGFDGRLPARLRSRAPVGCSDSFRRPHCFARLLPGPLFMPRNGAFQSRIAESRNSPTVAERH